MLDQRFSVASGPARTPCCNRATAFADACASLAAAWPASSPVGLALFTADRYLPLDYWLADQRTATGEQRTLRLADGTLINLNTHSAVDVRFDEAAPGRAAGRRDLVETAHGDARPFIVETREGSMRALGTRFLVKREAEGTRLSVLQSAVAAHPESAGKNRSCAKASKC
jgi:transmembrane sensor